MRLQSGRLESFFTHIRKHRMSAVCLAPRRSSWVGSSYDLMRLKIHRQQAHP